MTTDTPQPFFLFAKFYFLHLFPAQIEPDLAAERFKLFDLLLPDHFGDRLVNGLGFRFGLRGLEELFDQFFIQVESGSHDVISQYYALIICIVYAYVNPILLDLPCYTGLVLWGTKGDNHAL